MYSPYSLPWSSLLAKAIQDKMKPEKMAVPGKISVTIHWNDSNTTVQTI